MIAATAAPDGIYTVTPVGFLPALDSAVETGPGRYCQWAFPRVYIRDDEIVKAWDTAGAVWESDDEALS